MENTNYTEDSIIRGVTDDISAIVDLTTKLIDIIDRLDSELSLQLSKVEDLEADVSRLTQTIEQLESEASDETHA